MNGSRPELKQSAGVRDTIRAVSKTGGHLGSSLGVVELTVAFHKVFDAPEDRILWGVSHHPTAQDPDGKGAEWALQAAGRPTASEKGGKCDCFGAVTVPPQSPPPSACP